MWHLRNPSQFVSWVHVQRIVKNYDESCLRMTCNPSTLPSYRAPCTDLVDWFESRVCPDRLSDCDWDIRPRPTEWRLGGHNSRRSIHGSFSELLTQLPTSTLMVRIDQKTTYIYIPNYDSHVWTSKEHLYCRIMTRPLGGDIPAVSASQQETIM